MFVEVRISILSVTRGSPGGRRGPAVHSFDGVRSFNLLSTTERYMRSKRRAWGPAA
jgi:hypothetical protein